MRLSQLLCTLCLIHFFLNPAAGQDLKPLPPKSEAPSQAIPVPIPIPVESSPPVSGKPANGLGKSYWLMANGGPVGYKIGVEVNGAAVGSVRGTEQALDLTPHLKPGTNRVTLVQDESGARGGGTLAVTIGPELSRESSGPNQTYISLKENLVHFVRPSSHRGGEGEVDLHFSIGETPNPGLTQRYLLYSQGELSGHKISVGLNGSPLIDIAAPGAYCDLNPFLKPGENEFSFASEKLPGFAFDAADRSALEGKEFEVGVAVVGPYDPRTYNSAVNQLTHVVLRYTQPAGQDEPETPEKLTLMAE